MPWVAPSSKLEGRGKGCPQPPILCEVCFQIPPSTSGRRDLVLIGRVDTNGFSTCSQMDSPEAARGGMQGQAVETGGTRL